MNDAFVDYLKRWKFMKIDLIILYTLYSIDINNYIFDGIAINFIYCF